MKLPKRFLVKPVGDGYYAIDRLLVYAYILIIVATTITLLLTRGAADQMYLSCPGPSPCTNPLYQADCASIPTGVFWGTTSLPWNICQLKTLYPGYAYGNPPDPLTENAWAAYLLLLVITVIINHFLWNVGGEKNMNVKILVTPLTEKGRTAINQHFREIGFKEKMFMKAQRIKQEQLPDGSLLLQIPSTVNLSMNAAWNEMAKEVMKKNGASPEDYNLVVNTE